MPMKKVLPMSDDPLVPIPLQFDVMPDQKTKKYTQEQIFEARRNRQIKMRQQKIDRKERFKKKYPTFYADNQIK